MGGCRGAAEGTREPGRASTPTSHLLFLLPPLFRYWDADDDGVDSPSDNYCIIESRESVKDFAGLGLAEVREAVRARRNRIYFLMEEVRRLRIQARLKESALQGGGDAGLDDVAEEPFPSAIPFFPAVSDATVAAYGRLYAALVAAVILFGGLISPVLEVKLGLGGTSYADLIQAAGLPRVLAGVDPIVASFCGGAVGVLSTLLIVESNNAASVAANRCAYCGGAGYITCGACGGASRVGAAGAPSAPSSGPACATCSGTGKVACIGCLCTGKKVARETDQRLDPFS